MDQKQKQQQQHRQQRPRRLSKWTEMSDESIDAPALPRRPRHPVGSSEVDPITDELDKSSSRSVPYGTNDDGYKKKYKDEKNFHGRPTTAKSQDKISMGDKQSLSTTITATATEFFNQRAPQDDNPSRDVRSDSSLDSSSSSSSDTRPGAIHMRGSRPRRRNGDDVSSYSVDFDSYGDDGNYSTLNNHRTPEVLLNAVLVEEPEVNVTHQQNPQQQTLPPSAPESGGDHDDHRNTPERSDIHKMIKLFGIIIVIMLLALTITIPVVIKQLASTTTTNTTPGNVPAPTPTTTTTTTITGNGNNEEEEDGTLIIGTCGNGNFGNGICRDQTMCCEYGWCKHSQEHCTNVTPTQSPVTTTAPGPGNPTTTITTTPTSQGTCGDGNVGNGVCPQSNTHCCSIHGYCGQGPEYCNNESSATSTPAVSCGDGYRGNGICIQTWLCCSQYGYCGQGPEHCQN